MVDTTALIVRTISGFLDGFLGDRLGADLVMTAEEAYGVAAPLAGYVLDHRPESGPMAAAVEKAGLVGAGAGVVSYGARSLFFRRPGGRAESERIEENLVRRLARSAKRAKDWDVDDLASAPGGGATPPSTPGAGPTLNSLYGDEETGTGYA